MSAGFKAVQWNRRKIVYDAILIPESFCSSAPS